MYSFSERAELECHKRGLNRELKSLKTGNPQAKVKLQLPKISQIMDDSHFILLRRKNMLCVKINNVMCFSVGKILQ